MLDGRRTPRCEFRMRAEFDGVSWVFSMAFNGIFMGFNGNLMGFNGILMVI